MTGTNPTVGLRVADRYVLTHRIASGGMGEVWRGVDDVLGREVAVKVMHRRYAEDAEFLARFRAEARHAAPLSHPGIAAVFDHGESDDLAYLVMELVAGEPLSARPAREGALPVHRAVPDPVAQVVLYALAKDPTHRPPTAARFGQALGTALTLGPLATGTTAKGAGRRRIAAAAHLRGSPARNLNDSNHLTVRAMHTSMTKGTK